MNFKKTLAERLKLFREENNIKQQTIAKDLGISEKTYSDYECQKIEMRLNMLIKVAKYLNVSIDYLVGITDNPNINHIEKEITF